MKRWHYLTLLFLMSTHLVPATQNLPPLSLPERAMVWMGKIGGMAAGAVIGSKLGRKLVSLCFRDKSSENFDLGEIDLSMDLNLDLDKPIDLSSGSNMEDTETQTQDSNTPAQEVPSLDSFLKNPEEVLRAQGINLEGFEFSVNDKELYDDLDLDLEDIHKDLEKDVGNLGQDILKNIGLSALTSVSKSVGFIVGACIGYKGGNYLANRLLALHHGISYHTEQICQFFSINSTQWYAAIEGAEMRDIPKMRKAIEANYEKHFGIKWKETIESLFAQYSSLQSLAQKAKDKLTKSEQDMLHITKVGSALYAFYNRTNPSIYDSNAKNIGVIRDARHLYRQLELIF